MSERDEPTVVLVDDEANIRRILARELENLGLKTHACEDAAAARKLLKDVDPDVIVLDVRLPGVKGDVFLEELRQTAPRVPVIMLTGHANIDLAVKCMKSGAVDLLTKPCSIEHLELSIRRAIENRQLKEQTQTITRHAQPRRPLPDLVGSSPKMAKLRRLIEKVAGSEEAILIGGESGTGKELIAQAIQRRSRRSQAPYITVNCAAVTETLLESELFGHEKGAFSGAEDRRLGFFEIASGGTLFLDEIGDMPLSMQPKLLRVLQSGEFRRVGGSKTLHADVRIIAATNKDLFEEVREGRFREDLMHRINTIMLEAPALRDHIEDLEELIAFVARDSGEPEGRKTFQRETLDIMRVYRWPGNIRELRNVVRRAFILSEGDEIEPEDLPPHVRSRGTNGRGSAAEPVGDHVFDSELTLADLEKRHILAMLDAKDGNKTQAARALGVSVKTLYNKLEAWNAELEDDSN